MLITDRFKAIQMQTSKVAYTKQNIAAAGHPKLFYKLLLLAITIYDIVLFSSLFDDRQSRRSRPVPPLFDYEAYWRRREMYTRKERGGAALLTRTK